MRTTYSSFFRTSQPKLLAAKSHFVIRVHHPISNAGRTVQYLPTEQQTTDIDKKSKSMGCMR